jgi:hypothetical protein
MPEYECPHCNRHFPTEEALERHVAGHERHEAATTATAPPPEGAAPSVYYEPPPPTKAGRVIGGIAMLWRGFWGLFWILVVIAVIVGVVAGIFGIGDKNTVDVPPNAPGNALLTSLKSEGKIDDFRAVEPDKGWTYQYEINGDSDFYVQFAGDSMQMKFPESDQDVADDISTAARSEGYSGGP